MKNTQENTQTIIQQNQQKSTQNAITIGKTLGNIHNLKTAIKLNYNTDYVIAAIEQIERRLDKIIL